MMPTILIREVPEHVMRLLDMRAAAAGQSREAWLRERLGELAAEPIVRDAYTLHYFTKTERQETVGSITRNPASHQVVRSMIAGPNAFQHAAHQQAEKLVQRNDPGDREEAIRLLREQFDVVFEGPVEYGPRPPLPPQYEKMTPEQRRAYAEEQHHQDKP